MTALLDTGYLYALADTSDQNHARALDLAGRVSEDLILPLTVVPEICYLLQSRLGHAALCAFVRELAFTQIQLEPLHKPDLVRVLEVLTQYADSGLDFVDASIMVVAERHDVRRILTVDRRHFSMVRPKHCDYFEILP
jgi:predicted nucleic acid-binding protein